MFCIHYIYRSWATFVFHHDDSRSVESSTTAVQKNHSPYATQQYSNAPFSSKKSSIVCTISSMLGLGKGKQFVAELSNYASSPHGNLTISLAILSSVHAKELLTQSSHRSDTIFLHTNTIYLCS